MSIPRIAIVGRPNVGKSSLMNMLAGAKVSIVDPTPGVTRDRVSSLVELPGDKPTDPVKIVEVTDTGGYGVYTAEGARFDDAGEDLSTLTSAIEGQIAAAVERADLILFVVDSQSGVTALDLTIGKLLREKLLGGRKGSHAKVVVVANKVDDTRWEADAVEASRLGFGEPMLVSAKTNYKRRDFRERLYEIVPAAGHDAPTAYPEMRIALVGRRNAGKSTFVNTLAGEERCIVSEIAGTTRDSIDVRFEMDGRSLVAIDTAGVRKRTKFADAVEHWAFNRCLLAIARADVVLLLLDATQEISGVDKRLGARVLEEHKPCAIVVTKWDLVEGRKNRKGQIVTAEDYAKYIEDELKGMTMCPIVFTSSVKHMGLQEAVSVAFDLFEQAGQRVTTAKLNEIIRRILDDRGPSSRLGSQAKVLYVSQVGVLPPTIVMVVNHAEMFTGQYERYLMNRLHEELPFGEVPIRLIIRERQRVELSELKSGRHRAETIAAREVPEFDPIKRKKKWLKQEEAEGNSVEFIDDADDDLPDIAAMEDWEDDEPAP
ncbi:MAG: ribosome biogenesis GTPase Der [Phycisphaerae bacterium]|nr:ribosome biogenesis GTPase Der [Phycisphaerae bacterium]